MVGFELVVAQRLDFFIHQRLDLVGARVADDDETAIVANEHRQILVLQDRGELLEQRRLFRRVDVLFDLVARLAA